MKEKNLPLAILRWSLSLVFLYFGFSQVINPPSWARIVPEFLTKSFISANNIVIMNAILELTLGIFLILGLYTKFSSLILSIHLLFITISMGFTPIGARDFGLTIATLFIFLSDLDRYTLDWTIKNRITIPNQKI